MQMIEEEIPNKESMVHSAPEKSDKDPPNKPLPPGRKEQCNVEY